MKLGAIHSMDYKISFLFLMSMFGEYKVKPFRTLKNVISISNRDLYIGTESRLLSQSVPIIRWKIAFRYG